MTTPPGGTRRDCSVSGVPPHPHGNPMYISMVTLGVGVVGVMVGVVVGTVGELEGEPVTATGVATGRRL